MRFFVVLLCSLMFGSLQANAGDTLDNSQRATFHIRQLKKGTLIIRLPSERKKLEWYQSQLAKKPDNADLQERIQSIRVERDSNNRNLILGFQRNFKFCDFLFIYDYDTRRAQQGDSTGYFLNENLEFDPSLRLRKGPIYFAGYDQADNGIEVLRMSDADLRVLQRPFPYYRRANSFSLVLTTILNPKDSVRRKGTKLAAKWNTALQRFYDNRRDTPAPEE